MVYRFKHSDSNITVALRRIALDQIDKALASSKQRDDLHAGIHDARKKCKKLRGLIRLVRPAFSAYSDENSALREAARHLAPLRARGADIETLDRLVCGYPDDIDRDAAETVRAALKGRADVAEIYGLEARLAAFCIDIMACRQRISGWTLNDTGFSSLREGLEKTYASARKHMRIADKTRTPQAMHEWRKQVKYHWYHARLLKRLKPKKIAPRITAARELSQLLGDHHDLVDFRTLLEDATMPSDAGKAIFAHIAVDMARLEEASFHLGGKLFAAKPEVHGNRWRTWWRDW